MTWPRVLFAVVLFALLGSAASLWTHEPPPGKSWSVKSRPRVDKHPLGQKTLWEVTP